ncbi:MAG: arginine--tRNA ligase [Myxococcota bacterium]
MVVSIRTKLAKHLEGTLTRLQASGALTGDLPAVALSPPKEAAHGDFASNLAMLVAKSAKKNPREIAGLIQREVGDGGGLIAKCEVAGPGFINFFITQKAVMESFAEALAAGEGFVRTNHGEGKRVLVEFVSANPTGPLHLGHGRGAVVGDVVASLLDAAGFSVAREYYINDLGNQTDVMARSIYLRYAELCGRPFSPPEDFYPGEYITDIARAVHAEVGEALLDKPESEWIEKLKGRGIALMMKRIKDDLSAFNVRFDSFVSERELSERVGLPAFVKRLEGLGHIFMEEGKTWFRSTTFGDDKDRVLIREDGRPTYVTADLAYHEDKLKRGFVGLVNVLGADHGGYVARVRAGIAALGYDAKALEVILIQIVSISRGGEAVRMGKRLGTAVWLREVLEQVGPDAFRYFFIMRRSDAQMDFDLELATKKTLDNPVFYAQMGHARMCAIVRKADEQGVPRPVYSPGALDALTLPEEIALVKTMLRAPEVVVDAAVSREPHQVVHYIQDLIAQFHSYYSQYKGTERVVSADPVKTRARLLLCEGLRVTLKALLGILGVSAPDRMSLDDATE